MISQITHLNEDHLCLYPVATINLTESHWVKQLISTFSWSSSHSLNIFTLSVFILRTPDPCFLILLGCEIINPRAIFSWWLWPQLSNTLALQVRLTKSWDWLYHTQTPDISINMRSLNIIKQYKTHIIQITMHNLTERNTLNTSPYVLFRKNRRQLAHQTCWSWFLYIIFHSKKNRDPKKKWRCQRLGHRHSMYNKSILLYRELRKTQNIKNRQRNWKES